jgi:hypothetical protein
MILAKKKKRVGKEEIRAVIKYYKTILKKDGFFKLI